MGRTSNDRHFVAVTGATGCIGHCALASLLRTGRRCLALVRDPARDGARLRALLLPFGLHADRLMESERLILHSADLPGGVGAAGVAVRDVLHAAGCTRFSTDSAGDPHRTNVDGLRAVLDWAGRQGAVAFHLLSTAYVCGKGAGTVAEEFDPAPREFHNAYEESKWLGERAATEWARRRACRTLTILRPSIVVGDSATGRTTSFSGFYLAVRAMEAVAQRARERGSVEPLRAPGRTEGCQNIVPVDYVSEMAAGIVRRRDLHGGVYHLVNPSPPTNGAVRDGLERCVGIRAVGFEDVGDARERTDLERLFDRLIEPIRPYLEDTPRFERARTARAEAALRIGAPSITVGMIERLARWAIQSGWVADHRRASDATPVGRARALSVADYFEGFLPERVARSQVARMHGVSATVRFVLTDVEDGQWVCRFEGGRLERTRRGVNGMREDFGYRLDAESFLRAVGGELEPQRVFLDGRVEVFGDVERALKMAMVLHMFNREHPFRARDAVREGGCDG